MERLSRVGAGEATTCLRVGSTGNRCLNFSDPFGLRACKDEGYRDHYDYSEQGTLPNGFPNVSLTLHDCSRERIAHEIEEIGRAAERRCALRAGFWASTAAADAFALGELYRGGRVAAKGFLRARGLAKLFAKV